MTMLFHDGAEIKAVKLTDWLDWVTGRSPTVFVALPMLQRGSVWNAVQVVELWDSLLRGMPVGSFLVSKLRAGFIRRTGENLAEEMKEVPPNGISLLDGQQRTLAMCLGWTMPDDRRIWVDFGQHPTGGQLFKLRVTTTYHPFGYNSADQRQKLSRAARREARSQFDSTHGASKDKLDYQLSLDDTRPYSASCPRMLHELIDEWRKKESTEYWRDSVIARFLPEHQTDQLKRRICILSDSLDRLFKMQVALIRVRDEIVDDDNVENVEELPLAALFRRIANGGTGLSAEDHVFALIKHRVPEAHNLVYELHGQHNIASLLTPNELVMTAVRVAASEAKQPNGEPFADVVRPSARDFHRLIKAPVADNGTFLGNIVLPLIRCVPNDKSSLDAAFQWLFNLIQYRGQCGAVDTGLPLLAMPLLRRSLVQPLIFWVRRMLLSGWREERFEESRGELLRFVLYWLLAVQDPSKVQDRASAVIFRELGSCDEQLFPGKRLAAELANENLAIALEHPCAVAHIASPPYGRASVETLKPLRGWESRFRTEEGKSPMEGRARMVFERWWYRKAMLLWLQRDFLFSEFPNANPVAGRDEETPFDYDHICPAAHWSDGRSNNIQGFCEPWAHGVVGNSIGNLRVWSSSRNRGDGDNSIRKKLELDDAESMLWRHSAIGADELADWRICSGEETRPTYWDEARALAFGCAVEKRAIQLYRRFFDEAGFEQWIPCEAVEPSNGGVA